MIKLREVYKYVSSKNLEEAYRVRDIFINPEHIRSIRDSSMMIQSLMENTKHDPSLSNRSFCVLSLEKEEVVVVGTLREVENRLSGGKVLLNG